MSDWLGIFTHTSAVDPRPGVSEYQTNTHLRKRGELQRRPGMLSTAIAKQSGPIYDIMSASGLGQNFLTFDLGGEAGGFSSSGSVDAFPAPPAGVKILRPRGRGGVPQAPTILSIVYSPASPQAYQAGLVSASATISYDGLSGTLTYSWSTFTSYPSSGPLAVNLTSNPAIWDFDAGCIPGGYSGASLMITTQFNGFSDFMPLADFEVS